MGQRMGLLVWGGSVPRAPGLGYGGVGWGQARVFCWNCALETILIDIVLIFKVIDVKAH